jgi:hypothetical protein
MVSDYFQLVLILQELKKLNNTVTVFEEAIKTYNTELLDRKGLLYLDRFFRVRRAHTELCDFHFTFAFLFWEP